MGRHRERRHDTGLRWTDWLFVGVMTIVASAGSYLFVVYLFERLDV